MPESLSAALTNRCRAVFAQCSEFGSHTLLRSVFVTQQLVPFRLGLPDADSSAERIDLCIEYLLGKRLAGGQPVLPVFIEALRDKYPQGDALRDELQALCAEVTAELNPKPAVRSPKLNQELYQLLLRLDFSDPIREAHKIIRARPISAFLVSGQPECAQEVLTYRLLRLCSKADTARIIRINAGQPGVGVSRRALWREVLKSLEITPNGNVAPSPAQIAERVFEWWQDKDVIFVFHMVDYIGADLLSAWITDFWQPIVTDAQKRLNGSARATRLLLLLVDYRGVVPSWSIPWAQADDQPAYPLYPLPLPPARRFTEKDIDDWLNFALGELPLETDLTAPALLAETENGLPALVFERICAHCGLNWEGELTKWLQ
jgi:hypothetical protein